MHGDLSAAHDVAWPDMHQPLMFQSVAPAEQERSELARQDTGGQHLQGGMAAAL